MKNTFKLLIVISLLSGCAFPKKKSANKFEIGPHCVKSK